MAKNAPDQPAATTTDDDKARGQRSPLYPFIPLGKAIERTRTLYAVVKKNPSRVSTVVTAWKYGTKSSGGMQTIAALKQFGLLADQGVGENRRLTITDLALRLILGNDEAANRDAVQRAALNPTIHAELWSKWERELPGDPAIRDYLIFDRKFNPAGADDLIREYRDTLAFSGLLDSGTESLPDGDETGEEAVTMETPPAEHGGHKPPSQRPAGEREWQRLVLPDGRTVRLLLTGPDPTQREMGWLIKYLSLTKEVLPPMTFNRADGQTVTREGVKEQIPRDKFASKEWTRPDQAALWARANLQLMDPTQWEELRAVCVEIWTEEGGPG